MKIHQAIWDIALTTKLKKFHFFKVHSKNTYKKYKDLIQIYMLKNLNLSYMTSYFHEVIALSFLFLLFLTLNVGY